MSAPFILNEVWPQQRNRRRLTPTERDYRNRVRKNKRIASLKATNARISAERAERAKERKANAEKISNNETLAIYCIFRYKMP